MSQKQIEQLAQLIKQIRQDTGGSNRPAFSTRAEGQADIIIAVCRAMAEDDTFDTHKFLIACGY